jgi:hypothetical protein
MKTKGITMKDFLDKHSSEHVERVCAKAGTSYGNFQKVALWGGSISYDLAKKLEMASGGELQADVIRPLREPSKRGIRVAK